MDTLHEAGTPEMDGRRDLSEMAIDAGIDQIIKGLGERRGPVVRIDTARVSDAELLGLADQACSDGDLGVCSEYLERLVARSNDASLLQQARSRLGSRLQMACYGLKVRHQQPNPRGANAMQILERAFFATLLHDERAALAIAGAGMGACEPELRSGLYLHWKAQYAAAYRWARLLRDAGDVCDEVPHRIGIRGRGRLDDLCRGELAASLRRIVDDLRLFGEEWDESASIGMDYPTALLLFPERLEILSGVVAHCQRLLFNFVAPGEGWEAALVVRGDLPRAFRERLAEFGIRSRVSVMRNDQAQPALVVSAEMLLDGRATRITLNRTLDLAIDCSHAQLREVAAGHVGVDVGAVRITEWQELTRLDPFVPSPGLDLVPMRREQLLGRWRCRHDKAQWRTIGRVSAALGCRTCGCERLVVVPRHRLPADHPLAATDPRYLQHLKAVAIMAGEDPDAIAAGSVSELREADGVTETDPGYYAIGLPTRPLGPGRGVDEIVPRRTVAAR